MAGELKGMDTLDVQRAFEYLDELRESGQTNMFGAAPYLAEAQGWEKSEARSILSAWMKYDLSETAPRRAENATDDEE